MATMRPKFENFALQPMENLKRYSLVPVKDNCVLFSPTPYFSGLDNLTVSFKFTPDHHLLP